MISSLSLFFFISGLFFQVLFWDPLFSSNPVHECWFFQWSKPMQPPVKYENHPSDHRPGLRLPGVRHESSPLPKTFIRREILCDFIELSFKTMGFFLLFKKSLIFKLFFFTCLQIVDRPHRLRKSGDVSETSLAMCGF